jgi:sugar (pentulose or hexulose) kinase
MITGCQVAAGTTDAVAAVLAVEAVSRARALTASLLTVSSSPHRSFLDEDRSHQILAMPSNKPMATTHLNLKRIASFEKQDFRQKPMNLGN